MNADVIRIQRPTTSSKLFAHTRWDAMPALPDLFHLAYLFGLYLLFPHLPLWVMLILGFIYSLMVNANINGVGHNFIHNPFFRSTASESAFLESPNRLPAASRRRCTTPCTCSITRGTRIGRMQNGDTIDWLSIYRHGHDGEAENPWSYVFLSFFRDDVGAIRKELRKRDNGDLLWGNIELAAFATTLF